MKFYKLRVKLLELEMKLGKNKKLQKSFMKNSRSAKLNKIS